MLSQDYCITSIQPLIDHFHRYFDKKKTAAKKEQKTIDASAKVSFMYKFLNHFLWFDKWEDFFLTACICMLVCLNVNAFLLYL